MNRILIIGCPGSGKSTLARELGKQLNMPVVHLDRLWWSGDWQHISREEFDRRLENVLQKDRWIIDGNYSRTIPQRLERCDTILYLDFGRFACLWGAIKRILTGCGKVRPDMAPGCPERFDLEFLKYIWNFNKHNRVQNYLYIAQAKHAKTLVMKNRREVRQFLDKLNERTAQAL